MGMSEISLNILHILYESIGSVTLAHTRAHFTCIVTSFLCVSVLINLNIYCYPILAIIIGSACLLCYSVRLSIRNHTQCRADERNEITK